jgi:hypothetical protein
LGKVTRVLKGLTEFELGQIDGLTPGVRLLVIRPSAGNAVVDEVAVTVVNSRLSAGKMIHKQVLPGDLVVFQHTLPPGAEPASADASGGMGVFAEITFFSAPRGESRTTFNAQIKRVSWAGLIDIRDIEADFFLDQIRRVTWTVPAPAIKQMRLNGNLFAVDTPKKTMVTVAVIDYRQVLRAKEAQRERIRLGEIASEERIRTAEAKARIAADSDERIRLAELASQERIQLERISAEKERALADAQVQQRQHDDVLERLARLERERAGRSRSVASVPATEAYQPGGGATRFVDSAYDISLPPPPDFDKPPEHYLSSAWNLIVGINSAYKAIKALDYPPENKLEAFSQGVDAIGSAVGIYKAITSF